jgi:subtilase family serine protease
VEIIIEFDESMDAESVESAILITPDVNYSCLWNNENKSLIIQFSESLAYETVYRIKINTNAKDTKGHGLEDPYEIEFTTEKGPKEDDSQEIIRYPIIIILIIIIIVILVVLVVVKKRK